MSKGAIFWVMAAIVTVGYTLRLELDSGPALRLTTVAACFAVSVTGFVLFGAITDGGTAKSLITAHESVEVQNGHLLLPSDEAALARNLNNVALSAELDQGTPVVDLTGVSAGYALQLGGSRLGREFYMGIFPGAKDAAAYAVAAASCESREKAWVLWAPDNRWDVSGKVDLNGRRLPDDYESLMTFSPVQGPAAWHTLRIQVLRPRPEPSRCP
jgi:hypothetical protein